MKRAVKVENHCDHSKLILFTRQGETHGGDAASGFIFGFSQVRHIFRNPLPLCANLVRFPLTGSVVA